MGMEGRKGENLAAYVAEFEAFGYTDGSGLRK